ncbi:E3 ubiquitin-protein ligase TRIM39-like [Sciurus carolinensis]|uniref:E3 ubiquitin-protein ligase TRIM39-like n=1 Tax=Sciurus carolinensis TaxID=30640 RepID=UPI001FB2442B|nr:E3 ubiquitin-protein ligase TRIM39-like [Sciurus carolinensis]
MAGVVPEAFSLTQSEDGCPSQSEGQQQIKPECPEVGSLKTPARKNVCVDPYQVKGSKAPDPHHQPGQRAAAATWSFQESELLYSSVLTPCPSVFPYCSQVTDLLSSAEDVTLDEDTAHPSLAVSPDGKHVHFVHMKQVVPDYPERFTVMPFMLGSNRFSSSRHYGEVEVAGKIRWKIGLCLDSVKRKLPYVYTFPENGFWSLSLKDGRYHALSVPRFAINVQAAPEIVGVFLQYEAGLISFYDVKASAILYTFKSKFTQPLGRISTLDLLLKETLGVLTSSS